MHPQDLFSLFGVGIDLYTIMFVIGIIACLLFAIFAMNKCGYSNTARDTIITIGIFAIMFGLLFAALFQAFYNLIAGKGFTFEGMTFIGGLIGGVLAFVGIYFLYVYVINPRLKESSFFKSNMNKGIWYLLRIAPISICIAHGFGRIGCLCAGCCYGHETHAWYGVWNEYLGHKTVPIQLFESIFLFTLAAIMTVLLILKQKDNMAIYLVSYGIWRFVIEYFRADYRGDFIPGLSPSQFWSIIMVLVGIVIFFLYRYFDKKIEEKSKNTDEKANSL